MHLDTFAFCPASQRWAVSRAAGAEPLTSPPMTAEAFDAGLLLDRDLLYISLHGLPDQPYWYGDDYLTALSVQAFTFGTAHRHLSLRHTVVYVASCHFTDGPFLDAIKTCRPRALIAGSGENYARSHSLVGPHLLGYYLRRALEAGLPPRLALATAKYRVQITTNRLKSHAKTRDTRLEEDIAANTDALRFEVLT